MPPKRRKRTMRGRGEELLSEDQLMQNAINSVIHAPRVAPHPNVEPSLHGIMKERNHPYYDHGKVFNLVRGSWTKGIGQALNDFVDVHRERKTLSNWLERKRHNKLASVARFFGFGRKRKPATRSAKRNAVRRKATKRKTTTRKRRRVMRGGMIPTSLVSRIHLF